MMKPLYLTILFFVLFVFNTQAQTTYYVSATNGSDSNDGTSPSTPFPRIQAALEVATSDGDQILVTAETYTISSVITVNEDIDITGGYNATFSEQTGYTTLDGNNAKRIIDFIGVAGSVTFDHFIIQNGYRYNGGGMYIEESDLSLTNIIFYNNTANGEKGGAIYMDKSNPSLTNVAFIGNSSKLNGGAMYLDESCPTLTNATFYDNTATNTAGSIYLIGASIPVIRNTVFYNNIAQSTSYEDIDSYNWTNCYVATISAYNASNNANAYDNPSVLSARYGTFISFVLLLSDPFINSSDPDGDDNIFGTYDDGLVPANQLKEKGYDSYNPLSYDLQGRNRKIGTIDIGAYEGVLIYYIVNGLETGNHDGSDWDNAFDDLHYAINNYGTKGVIFHVATATTSQPYFLDSSLEVTEDIEIYGGYDVTTDTQTGYTALDGNGEHQVIYTKNLTSKAVFDHLIIQNGYVGGYDEGGGMYNRNSSPTLTNVIFKENKAYFGGGLYNYYSKPKLINVVFNENTAKSYGGGMYNKNSSPTLRNVIFTGNSAVNGGGGIDNTSSNPILINVVFNGNSSDTNGAAISSFFATTLTLINVTFVNNSAPGEGVIYQSETTLNLYNTVFYANTPTYDISISSDILGTNNASNRTSGGLEDTDGFIVLTSDPFTNSSTPEGEDGEWFTADDGLIPAKGSQLINTGDKSYNSTDTDILGEQRVQKNRIDIGAYETDYYAASSTFTGIGSWGIDTLWSAGMIDEGGTAIIDGTCRITSTDRTVDNLTINNSASLILYPGVVMTVNNTVINNAGASGLVLKSDATETTQFINSTPDVSATVERYITGNAWHLVSSPAPGGAISAFLAANTNVPTKDVSGTDRRGMMDYNESANDWNPFFLNSDQTGNLDAGKGFSLRTGANGTVAFTGTLATGDVNATVARTDNYGWNCVGNPYPSAIAINSNAGASNFIASNYDSGTPSNGNLDPNYTSVYVWEQGAYTIISLGDEAFYAQAGQAFMVKANTGKTTVQFTTAMQTHQPLAAFKSGMISSPELKLTASMDEKERTARIKFSDEMTTGLDVGYDAGVFKTGFDIYTKLVEDNGVDFGLQCLPETGMEQYEIPVGIDATTSGEIIFSLKSENLSSGIVPVLNDKLTGTSFSFENESDVYTTSIMDGTKGYGRFTLTFSSTTGIDETAIPNFKAWCSEGYIYISGQMDEAGEATVYDIDGRKVAIHQLSYSNQNRIEAPQGANGIYFVKIKDSKRSEVLKVPVTGR